MTVLLTSLANSSVSSIILSSSRSGLTVLKNRIFDLFAKISPKSFTNYESISVYIRGNGGPLPVNWPPRDP